MIIKWRKKKGCSVWIGRYDGSNDFLITTTTNGEGSCYILRKLARNMRGWKYATLKEAKETADREVRLFPTKYGTKRE